MAVLMNEREEMSVAVSNVMSLLTDGIGLESVKCVDVCRIGSPTARRESMAALQGSLGTVT
jgi:hypothetical protein